jgi:hypothetical protein
LQVRGVALACALECCGEGSRRADDDDSDDDAAIN